jgi:mannose-1-phosphate guanylyltransferase/phosphomannomutase
MKALILCAGYGTRLGDLTREIPKPMLPIGGKPLLAYNIRYLARYGFDQIAINLHFKPEIIKDYFGDGSALGVSLHYVYEETLLGTAGAVKNLADYFSDADDFLVMYGDLLIDQDLTAMLAFHRAKQVSATLLLHQRANSNSLVQMDSDNRITHFIERPTEEQRQAAPYPWVNSGLQILNRRMRPHIPDKQPADLPRDVFMPALQHEAIYGFPLTGYRCAIDSPSRYIEAQAAVAEGRMKVFA